MSEKEEKNDFVRNFKENLLTIKKDYELRIKKDLEDIEIRKAEIKQIDEALKRLEITEEPDDESDDPVLEEAEEKFEGNRERFD